VLEVYLQTSSRWKEEKMKKIETAILILVLAVGLSCKPKDESKTTTEPSGQAVTAESVYDFELDDIDGNPTKLSEYEGKVLLIVNVASECGFTPQYAGLQAIYKQYQDRGFAVLGFPANNFGNQEPGTNEQIKRFCTTAFGVSFPLFAKISVKGQDKHPLYQYLTATEAGRQFGGEIKWNFNKFLIDRNGQVIAVYGSKTEPQDPQLTADIESALGKAGGGL
jgi:glutathione peroxidase